MPSFSSIYDSLFQESATLAQFAKNGVWEEAWAFDLDNLPSNSELKDYLIGSDEVAFELFFGNAFLGLRCNQKDRVVSFAQDCVNLLKPNIKASVFIKSIEDLFDVPLFREPLFTEVGSINAWKSVGAFTLPTPLLALKSYDALWEKIVVSPVSQDPLHIKAVEIAFDSKFPHWFGFPISELQPPYKLQKKELFTVLQRFSRISLT